MEKLEKFMENLANIGFIMFGVLLFFIVFSLGVLLIKTTWNSIYG
jgi:hypothetical protein